MDCTHKFRNLFWSSLAVRRLSDMVCVEHGKSIIEHANRHGKTYADWLGVNHRVSNRDTLREAINTALAQRPATFDDLLALLEKGGYTIKYGKQPSFRKDGQKRFVRLDTLGEEYSKEVLSAVIAGKQAHKPKRKRIAIHEEKPTSLLVDVEAKLQAGKGAGYARWAKIFNAKQLAKTITYLSERGFSDMDALRTRADEAAAQTNSLLEQSRNLDRRIKEVSELRTHVINYMRTKDVFAEYKRSGYPRAFLEAHEAEIAMQREAKRYFNEHGCKKLPTGAKLKEEIDRLKSEKGAVYEAYRNARDEMRELLVVRGNVEWILRDEEVQRDERKIPAQNKPLRAITRNAGQESVPLRR